MKDVHQKLQNSNNPEYSVDILIAQNIFNNSISMFQEDDSCYSNDEEYFSDLCRGGEIEECKEFLDGLNEESNFNWGWFNDRQENFIHMLAANNYVDMFDFVFSIVKKKCSSELVEEILNKKNSEQNTPLHYAVITDCKEMVTKLLEAGANANISNQHSRTPFEEAQQFGKFEIAEILANVTKIDIKQIQKMASDLKLNDDSSDEDEEPTIMEKIQEKDQQPKQQS